VPVAPEWPGLAPFPGGDSLDARWGLARVGWEMFREHPLTGVGRGNYYRLYAEYVPRVDPTLPPGPMGPHNTPLHIAAQTGLLGLAAFTALVLAAVAGLRAAKRRLARAFPEEAGLLEAVELAIYAFLASSLFLNDNAYQRYLWLLIALAAAGRRVALGAVSSGPTRPA
jgi:O-antigen ligase